MEKQTVGKKRLTAACKNLPIKSRDLKPTDSKIKTQKSQECLKTLDKDSANKELPVNQGDNSKEEKQHNASIENICMTGNLEASLTKSVKYESHCSIFNKEPFPDDSQKTSPRKSKDIECVADNTGKLIDFIDSQKSPDNKTTGALQIKLSQNIDLLNTTNVTTDLIQFSPLLKPKRAYCRVHLRNNDDEIPMKQGDTRFLFSPITKSYRNSNRVPYPNSYRNRNTHSCRKRYPNANHSPYRNSHRNRDCETSCASDSEPRLKQSRYSYKHSDSRPHRNLYRINQDTHPKRHRNAYRDDQDSDPEHRRNPYRYNQDSHPKPHRNAYRDDQDSDPEPRRNPYQYSYQNFDSEHHQNPSSYPYHYHD